VQFTHHTILFLPRVQQPRKGTVYITKNIHDILR